MAETDVYGVYGVYDVYDVYGVYGVYVVFAVYGVYDVCSVYVACMVSVWSSMVSVMEWKKRSLVKSEVIFAHRTGLVHRVDDVVLKPHIFRVIL
jgi:hypothetical protein